MSVVSETDTTDSYTESNTEWVKFGEILPLHLIGKETIACGTGCHIRFYEINNKQEAIYNATSKDRGDGVQCMAGLRLQPLFAFAEKAYNPRLFILMYPDFAIVNKIKGGARCGYLLLCFSETEHLISLSTFPNFEFTVWNWKNGDRLARFDSNIRSLDQALRCSLSAPVNVCQMSSDGAIFLIWDINFCLRKCTLTRNEVKLPRRVIVHPCSAIWSPEGMLHVCDATANIYAVEADKSMNLVIRWPGDAGSNTPCAAWFKGGMVVSGPNSEVKLFKKGTTEWTCVWSVKVPFPIVKLIAYTPKEYLLGTTERGELFQWNMDSTTPLFVLVQNYGSAFTDLCIINPQGEYIAALDQRGDITIWEIETGDILGISSHGAVTVMTSNPVMPYIGIGKPNGVVEFINVFEPKTHCTLAAIRLSREDINAIQFIPSGHIAIVASLHTGQVYAIKIKPCERIEVVSYIELKTAIVQFVLMAEEEEEVVLLHAITKTTTCCKAGDKIIQWRLSLKSLIFTLNGPLEVFGTFVGLCLNPQGKWRCYAIPHRSRLLQVLKVPLFGDTIKITDVIPSGHQLRRYRMQTDGKYLISCGLDGLVILRMAKTRNCMAILMPHHRNSGGTLKAVVDPIGLNVISLGKNGTLICTSLNLLYSDEDIEKLTYNNQMKEENSRMLLQNSSSKVFISVNPEEKTWLELRQESKIRVETLQFSNERMQLWEDFQELQRKTVELLDCNFANPPEEQLPISAFDLDPASRERNELKEKLEREALTVRTLAVCAAQDKLSKKIKEKCWDVMDVKGKCMKAIAGNFEVENYALLPQDPSVNEAFQQLVERRKVEEEVNRGESFYPWLPESSLDLLVSPPPEPEVEEAAVPKPVTPTGEHDEEPPHGATAEKHEEVTEVVDGPFAWSGTTSHNFVEVSTCHGSQFACTTYNQVCEEIILIKKVTNDLRLYFNKQFDNLFAEKEREMNLVFEKHNRLRYVLAELGNTTTVVKDPLWYPTEKPDTIVHVEDKEVCVLPYVSPEEQLVLDKIEAENEAIRLAELADNFREKALIQMMDGVLEVRWEDTIKKDITQPKCMIEKQPEDWNEEDLRTVKEYEAKVAFLMSERERYKNMLEVEQKKLTDALKEGIKKFDQRLAALYLLKLKVESSIDQEDLKVLRYRLQCQHRIVLDREEDKLKMKVKNQEHVIEAIKIEIGQLQAIVTDGRTMYEYLTIKDKKLEKDFRKDFQDLSQIVVDQLYKAYKKRPKTTPRTFISPTMANEMAKCCVTFDKPASLSVECMEYLKTMDSLDHNSNAPSNVTEEIWQTLCRNRRVKVESEIKVKNCALELAEGESTISIFQKRLTAAREANTMFHTQMHQLREEKLDMIINEEVQLVMKQGLVEVPQSGSLTDFSDAVLVKRSNIEYLNKEILTAGAKKLKAMEDTMNFRRGIIRMEWEHKSKMMQIEDLRESLHTTELFKVTQEIQTLLRRRFKGLPIEKGNVTAQYEKDFETLCMYYDRIFTEIKQEILVMENQIKDKKEENRKVDKAIVNLNVTVNHPQLRRNVLQQEKETKAAEERISAIMQRSRLCSQIQKQHSEILVLQTELELLRLKTYPTLKYNILAGGDK